MTQEEIQIVERVEGFSKQITAAQTELRLARDRKAKAEDQIAALEQRIRLLNSDADKELMKLHKDCEEVPGGVLDA